MAETQLNILICGLTSDSSLLFIPLYKYLKNKNYEVSFFVPEYSGAICLIDKEIQYLRLKDLSSDSDLSSEEASLLNTCLKFDLEQNEFSSFIIRFIKKRVIKKEGLRLFKACKKYYGKKKIDLIIVWGGIRYHSNIPALVAKLHRIPCVYIEKGLYPFTLQVDDQGVNGLGRLKSEFSKKVVKDESYSLDFYQSLLKEKWCFIQPVTAIKIKIKLKYFIKEFAVYEFLIKVYHKYFETKILKKYKYKEKWNVTDPITTADRIEESDYIFIPFQVSDDSQLLIQDSWIRDNKSLVISVANGLRQLGIKRKIVIKEHPREFRNINYSEILKHEDILFSKAGTIDLISRSNLVITINSTVGFEAVVFGKPVIITGSSLYESIPFIVKVNNQSELNLNLKRFLSINYQFDKTEVNKHVSAVYEKLVKCNYVSPSEKEINNLWNKISGLRLTSS